MTRTASLQYKPIGRAPMSVPMATDDRRAQQHVLIATVAIQGHINPVRHLARRLARKAGVRVTVAIPLSSHRRMFPSAKPPDAAEGDDRSVSYAAYSDGFDDRPTHDGAHFVSQLKLVGSQTLARLALSLARQGRPVTCVLYTTLAHWASDVARDVLGVPSFLLLTQPAAVFSIYHHYFNHHLRGDKQQILQQLCSNIAGLPLQLEIEDLSTVLTDADNSYLDSYADIMKTLEKDRERSAPPGRPPRVVINTFHALEADVIEAIKGDLEFVTVGPLMEEQRGGDGGGDGGDLFERDKSSYLEWLDSKEERSVVYISFGSLSMLSKVQMEEMWKGLKESRRPYLWVVRKDARDKHILQQSSKIGPLLPQEGEEGGVVVEWCDQVRVLSHRAVGCFLTHCGWNSTMESIVHGVPMVVVPQRIDQPTNARLVEGLWGNGVRAATEGEGLRRVMRGKELVRCLDVVMGDGPGGARIREKAKMWREKASEAIADDGPSMQSLMAFVNGI